MSKCRLNKLILSIVSFLSVVFVVITFTNTGLAAVYEDSLPTLGTDTKQNVIDIALSQVDTVEDAETHYTIYAHWYDEDNQNVLNWSNIFIQYVLHYAGVDYLPNSIDTETFVNSVSSEYKKDNTYTPTEGDLVYLDSDEDGEIDYIGILVDSDDDGEIDDVIIGDYDDKVSKIENYTDTFTQLGYVSIPEEIDSITINNSTSSALSTPSALTTPSALSTPSALTTPSVLTKSVNGYTITITDDNNVIPGGTILDFDIINDTTYQDLLNAYLGTTKTLTSSAILKLIDESGNTIIPTGDVVVNITWDSSYGTYDKLIKYTSVDSSLTVEEITPDEITSTSITYTTDELGYIAIYSEEEITNPSTYTISYIKKGPNTNTNATDPSVVKDKIINLNYNTYVGYTVGPGGYDSNGNLLLKYDDTRTDCNTDTDVKCDRTFTLPTPKTTKSGVVTTYGGDNGIIGTLYFQNVTTIHGRSVDATITIDKVVHTSNASLAAKDLAFIRFYRGNNGKIVVGHTTNNTYGVPSLYTYNGEAGNIPTTQTTITTTFYWSGSNYTSPVNDKFLVLGNDIDQGGYKEALTFEKNYSGLFYAFAASSYQTKGVSTTSSGGVMFTPTSGSASKSGDESWTQAGIYGIVYNGYTLTFRGSNCDTTYFVGYADSSDEAVKSIEDSDTHAEYYEAGEELTYNIDMTVGKFYDDQWDKYDKYEFVDYLPSEVDFKDARFYINDVEVANLTDKATNDYGTLSYDSEKHKVTFAFSSTYLSKLSSYNNQSIKIQIDVKIDENSAGDTIDNEGIVLINNNTYVTNEVSIYTTGFKMPETGGSGTNYCILMGLVLITISFVVGYISLRRESLE